jgi:hypothetical protein
MPPKPSQHHKKATKSTPVRIGKCPNPECPKGHKFFATSKQLQWHLGKQPSYRSYLATVIRKEAPEAGGILLFGLCWQKHGSRPEK